MNCEFLKKSYFINKGVYDNDIKENTTEAFNKAITENLGLFFNVIMTKDNKIVVFNDENLERLLNLKDEIKDTTYDELKYLSSYHIPLLSEVLDLVNGKVPIIINPINNDKHSLLLKELVKILDNYQYDIAIINENAYIIKWFNSNRPEYIVGEMIKKRHKCSFKNFIANFSIKTNFKLYNIDYFDEIKVKTLKKDSIVIGYLIENDKEYESFKDTFDNLIINDIKIIKKDV